MLRDKWETLPFKDAIELESRHAISGMEPSRTPGFVSTDRHVHQYLARGVYANHLKNWFRHYDRKQFLILSTEDFRNEPQRTLDQVFGFLDVVPFQVESLADLNIGRYGGMSHNTREFLVDYFRPHNEELSRMLRHDFDWDR